MAPILPARPKPVPAAAAPSAPAAAEVTAAIRQASAKTGVSFQYLVAQAEQESGFKPDARAATSSAAGLYQFIESTWLQMVREHGHKYGLGEYAREIRPAENGTPRIADAAMRTRILALREDPKIAATMAAEYARANHAQLHHTLGREVGATDLYFAHFLGPAGASKFLSALRGDPSRPAAEIMPEAAASNRGVFYDAHGRAQSVREIYNRFAAKFDPGRTESANAQAVAHAPAGGFGETRALEAVIRRTALAALSGRVLTPTVIAAVAALDLPGDAPDKPDEREPRSRHADRAGA